MLKAIANALESRTAWNMAWEQRAAIFLKAAELSQDHTELESMLQQ
jgi:hypothetical protein